ncbi:MAG: hypothetical protein LBV17_08985 [Treponema sp.]|nr:hypothetical protein [Treponema sp.]
MASDKEGKIYWGLAEELKGKTASRITVYGEKKNNIYLKYSQEDIKGLFPPIGKVFVTKPISSYQTFQIEYNSKKKENKDNDDYLAVDLSLKSIIFIKLITIQKLENPDTFPLEEIQKLWQNQKNPEGTGTYFIKISHNNELLGPFIRDQKELRPKTGKEVPVYEINNNFDDYIFDNDKLLFELSNIPFNKKGEVDCMSNLQLQDWLREKIKKSINFDDKSTITLLDKAKKLSIFDANDLDTARLKRVSDCLDQYKFSYEELKDLFAKDGFEKTNNIIKNMRSEIKDEYEKELNKDLEIIINQKQNIEKEKNIIITEIENLRTENEKIKSELSDLEKMQKQVNENYDLLLLKLKVDAKINTGIDSGQKNKIKPLPFIVSSVGKSFDTIKEDGLDQFDLIKKNLSRTGYNDHLLDLYRSENDVLLKAKTVFIPCISWAYIYAQSIGNAKVYTMHIEHDWLHYSDFCNNGLIDIWNEAINDRATNYILVLDKLNITQPECGMMPLLDVINRYRPFLEGTNSGLPDNLKVFATILPYNENESVGLKLSRKLFRTWGTFAEPDKQGYNIPIKLNNYEQYGYFNPDDFSYQQREPGDAYFGIR